MAIASTGAPVRDGFSIGEAASIIGVSTHVIRSWERRLSLDLNHRTPSNQRRYWLEDVQRFMAIRRLHESKGLPLVEAAAKVFDAPPDRTQGEPPADRETKLDGFWAALVDALPDILLVIDDSGRIAAANEPARRKLNVRRGGSFARLAPGGWRRAYHSLHSSAGSHRPSTALAMRGKDGIVYVDARVVPIGRVPGASAVLIGTGVRQPDAPERAEARSVLDSA